MVIFFSLVACPFHIFDFNFVAEVSDSRLYVGNLHSEVTDAELSRMFAKYGKVESSAVRSNPKTGATFGFIEFEDPRDAEAAIDGLNGREKDGKKMVVQFTKYLLSFVGNQFPVFQGFRTT